MEAFSLEDEEEGHLSAGQHEGSWSQSRIHLWISVDLKSWEEMTS